MTIIATVTAVMSVFVEVASLVSTDQQGTPWTCTPGLNSQVHRITCLKITTVSAMRLISRTGNSVRQRFPTRNSSGDEIANVNFLYDDIVHALKIQ